LTTTTNFIPPEGKGILSLSMTNYIRKGLSFGDNSLAALSAISIAMISMMFWVFGFPS